MIRRLLSLFTILIFSISVFAKDVPVLTGPVVDEARVITKETERKLSAALMRIYKESGIQIQVLTTDSLEGEVLEDYTIKVVDEWKLGNNDEKGVLFFLSINDRKSRVEVGRGLEGKLTDLYAGRITDKIKPFFKHKDFDGGVKFGVKLIANSVGQKLSTSRIKRSSKQKRLGFGSILFLWILLHFMRRGRRSFFYYGGGGGSWSGGGSSSWTGGGGGFSGGGASGDW